jgi:hypothetical protein
MNEFKPFEGKNAGRPKGGQPAARPTAVLQGNPDECRVIDRISLCVFSPGIFLRSSVALVHLIFNLAREAIVANRSYFVEWPDNHAPHLGATVFAPTSDMQR